MTNTDLAHRRIGELDVAALGLGCMGMSYAYGSADETESLATLNHALDIGINFLDTADVYGKGANEELLSKVLASRRDEVVLATKFGIVIDSDTGFPSRDACGTPDHVRACVDASLSRLGIDVIDLYYLHRVDFNTPIEDTVGAMAELVSAGKVRALGLSEASAENIRRAAAVHPIAALQSEWSIFSRDIESEILPTARELGIALVPYSPLGRGMLTGSSTAANPGDGDFRAGLPRWQGENLDANLALVNQIRSIADEVGATPGQVALAWLLAQGEDVVPIPGTKRRTYLDENVGALGVELSGGQLARLSSLEAVGDRYADMNWVNR